MPGLISDYHTTFVNSLEVDMNERIKQLYVQAIQYADSVVPKHDRYNDIYYAIVSGKHAELIVRECARAVDKVYEDAEPDHGCYDWATWAEGADVLKHFGVEE
jgi:hypothetical protein